MDVKNEVSKLLKDLVSSPTVSDMYAALLVIGPQTVSQLARSSGVERTRIYRNLNELQALQLVEIELQPNRQIIRPAPITNLQNLVALKKSALDAVLLGIDSFQQKYTQTGFIDAATKVKFYSGIDGLKQMLWNQTKAKSQLLSILSENIQSHTSRDFFERWVTRCNEQNIVCRGLVDDRFIEAQKLWYSGSFGHSLSNWQARKMPDALGTIPHRTTVYDNVTAYFSWQDNDVFGIEIYNQNIADSQRQYFELIWNASKDLAATLTRI